MLDVHPPHEPTHTWKDFFIHIATICVGLLIAVGLEQTVELFHHRHQRHTLEEDLHTEAMNNREVIARDLKIQELEPWFAQAAAAMDAAEAHAGKATVTLSPVPCLPGSIGTADYRYFAPSQAVWATAKESGLVILLPVERSRMYARLDHNYELLAKQREDVYDGCGTLLAMQQRFGKLSMDKAGVTWTLTAGQAEHFAEIASAEMIAIQGLCFRLRWSDVYEQGLVEGATHADTRMMTINQERFEHDSPTLEDTARH